MAGLAYRRPAILKKIPHDQHAVIEASAGTGKTHTIEYLVLDLLLATSCSVEEILVMTFTEKATAELRARVRALFESVLAGAAIPEHADVEDLVSIDDAQKLKLETALFSFDRAPIYTIHAFCQRILSDLAFDTGSGFGLEVIDSRRAFHRAFRAELREVLAVEHSTRALLEEWMRESETANPVATLEELLRQAHFNRYLDSAAPRQNELAIAEFAEHFDADLLMKACASKSRKAPAKALAAVDALSALVKQHRHSCDALRNALAEFEFAALPNRATVANSHHSPELLRMVEALDMVRVATSMEVRVVDTFLPRISDRLFRDKRQNREIDYSDMLEWVWNALDGPRGNSLVSILRERFRYGLIDEFQDTDDLQWKIFRRIFLESRAKSILYVVGDPKQAIYAFRGADVFTYLQARGEILPPGVAAIKLVENFRSTGSLIDALNLILNDKATSPVFSGDIRYDSPVECGRPDLRARHLNGNEIIPITLMRYSPGSLPGSAARTRATIGRHIASEIHRILHDDDSIVTIGDTDPPRRIEAKDIYILTRSGAEAVEIGTYLREQGIAFAFYKKEGLFQTAEAHDVLDILNAIADPDSQSRRLKAWTSPFFAVPYADLFGLPEIPSGHPLNERLYEWKAFADREQFAKLFDQLLHRSGLVNRELFLANSERELTNYLHIFEILLEQIFRERLSLDEAIERLQSFIAESALPAGIESNIQRIESERSAVQVMSVHLSKGLQADVVFLFGGTGLPPPPGPVCVYHDENHQRRIAVGKTARDIAKDVVRTETSQENARLAYVGITRARAKVYLPIYPSGTTVRPVNGYYAPLNNRLTKLAEDLDRGDIPTKLFEIVDVRHSNYDAKSVASKLETRIANWSPPESLILAKEEVKPERWFDIRRGRHRAMMTRSYTSLESRTAGRQRNIDSEVEVEDFKYPLDASADTIDLRGGRSVGIFLHEVIEKVDLESFLQAQDLGSWRAREDIQRLFVEAMRRHQVSDSRWFERGTEIVFNALTSRIATTAGRFVGPLYRCGSVREMEFAFPIPERSHALLQSNRNAGWPVERGYLNGFVDFVFEQNGLHYFADWKSDLLPSYERGSVRAHVKEHYDLQARIYSVGIVRLLRIRDKQEYDQRFGGLLYLFIRGIKREGAGEEGVYFRRPDWDEICLYERALIEVIAEAPTVR